MAIHEDEVDGIVLGFIARLEQEIPVHEVILFGSYAQGKAEEHSDIDLAVISDWFEGKPAIENIKFLARVAAHHNTLIEALPFCLTTSSQPIFFGSAHSLSGMN
jgi:predicted nucleotidyltransferase